MSDATQHAGLAVRASDAEREQTVALLQSNFADGRLTRAELEERASAAYSAQTSAQLRDLTADLPAAQQRPPRSGMVMNQRLLVILLCVHPQRPWSTGCYVAASDQPRRHRAGHSPPLVSKSDARPAASGATRGAGPHHFSFLITGIEGVLARFRASCIELVGLSLADPGWREAVSRSRCADQPASA